MTSFDGRRCHLPIRIDCGTPGLRSKLISLTGTLVPALVCTGLQLLVTQGLLSGRNPPNIAGSVGHGRDPITIEPVGGRLPDPRIAGQRPLISRIHVRDEHVECSGTMLLVSSNERVDFRGAD